LLLHGLELHVKAHLLGDFASVLTAAEEHDGAVAEGVDPGHGGVVWRQARPSTRAMASAERS
jgi:hypothetical protein